jgi:hypothetical protein
MPETATQPETDAVRELVRKAHPNPTIGGTPGSYWLACACGLYITAKPSVRSCRRSFSMHRVNEYARAAADLRAGRVQ